jgi:hypothetical protein
MTFLSSSRRDKVSLIFFFASLCSFSALAQTAAPTPTPPAQTGQVGPGKCATITPAKGVVPTPPNTAAPKVLDAALTSTTRKTLQDAMNATSTNDPAQPVAPAK